MLNIGEKAEMMTKAKARFVNRIKLQGSGDEIELAAPTIDETELQGDLKQYKTKSKSISELIVQY